MKIMKFSEIIVLDLRVKTSNYIAFKKRLIENWVELATKYENKSWYN